MSMRIEFPGFSVAVPEDWYDVTDSLNIVGCPFTLAIPDSGVGSLQFSPAIYKSGPIPNPTVAELAEMLSEFAGKQGFGDPVEQNILEVDEIFGATANYHHNDSFVEVWYISDGRNFMLATYFCGWSNRNVEANARNMIVRSIFF